MTLSYEIGVVAGICFVAGFGLLKLGVLRASSPVYQTLNLLGALGFAYTAIAPFNPGLFITEVVWTGFAVLGLWRIWAGRDSSEIPVETIETPGPIAD